MKRRPLLALVVAGGVAAAGAAGLVVRWKRPKPPAKPPVAAQSPVAMLRAGARALAVGDGYVCALTARGGVVCWGRNDKGQLGNGSTRDSAVPVQVRGAVEGAVAVAAGSRHSCELARDGDVLCWGDNSSGQLGDGSMRDSPVPVRVRGLGPGVTAIAAGSQHTCAITRRGGVECWGNNESGQLGDDSRHDRLVPVAIPVGSRVTAIAAGARHTCAATQSGVECWGDNSAGQLGDGTTRPSLSPVPVRRLGRVSGLVAGARHTCALRAGRVLCWGSGAFGQTGGGSYNGPSVPLPVPGLVDVKSVTAGAHHTCALGQNGSLVCWGLDDRGQLGNDSVEVPVAEEERSSPQPVAVADPGSARYLVAGGDNTCAVGRDGVLCWGDNDHGQLGNGFVVWSDVPFPVLPPRHPVASVATGASEVCGVTRAGAVICWPVVVSNREAGDRRWAVPVPGLGSGAKQVALASGGYDCALMRAGGVRCWGTGVPGDTFDLVPPSAVPVEVKGLGAPASAVAVSRSYFEVGVHACAVTHDGGVQCWGDNDSGELGDGSRADSAAPVRVHGLDAATSVAAGTRFSCALGRAGGVKCWGGGARGQLGDGSRRDSVVPVQVKGLESGVTGIAAGDEDACAIRKGRVLCWGSDYVGFVFDGGDRLAPVVVDGLGDVKVLAMGSGTNCALERGGLVACWDAAGNGAPEPRIVSGATSVAVGNEGACASTRGGRVVCWWDQGPLLPLFDPRM